MGINLNRAEVVDKQFVDSVLAEKFPPATSQTTVAQANLSRDVFLSLFESQMASRLLDIIARALKESGQSFYTIGSSGHEGNAAIALASGIQDMSFLHYRSAAFFIQRSLKYNNPNILRDLLRSFVASKQDPASGGRHKVFGSKEMLIPPQTSTIASHLPKAVATAFSIQRARELNIDRVLSDDSVIICSFGDASVNHSTALGAFNTAEWIRHAQYPLPIVFVCEDNGTGISVPTPKSWIETKFKHALFHYIAADGLHLPNVVWAAHQAFHLARKKKIPVFLHMKTIRLLGHAGSDVELHYRTEQAIRADEANDPLLHSARICVDEAWLSPQEIIDKYESLRATIKQLADEVLFEPKLTTAEAVMASLIPNPLQKSVPSIPEKIQREKLFGTQFKMLNTPRNMCQLINYALTDLMLQYKNMVIFGEDVGQKGGVYRVTADLQARFGRRRVFDTLLDEQTILGHAIGLAHNGFLPIPEIQFLAYYHNAQDQIRGEAATMSFFSNKQFTNPMVVRIASLGYQKGFGGHFHNDNSTAALRDLPGVIVACPSNGADAVKLLRTCVRLAYIEQRIVLFLEPIALYMTKDFLDKGDNRWLCTYPELHEEMVYGEVTQHGASDELAIISYGNGCYLSQQAAEILRNDHEISVAVIDLHWLAPLPLDALLPKIKDKKYVLIVDEGRSSGSVSEALIANILERLPEPPKIERITGCDSFIPTGDSWQTVLPNQQDIIEKILHSKVNARIS